jgi:hypothetical protein
VHIVLHGNDIFSGVLRCSGVLRRSVIPERSHARPFLRPHVVRDRSRDRSCALTRGFRQRSPKTRSVHCPYSNFASKISMSRSGGFAMGTPSAPTVNRRHNVGTRIPEKR